MQSARNITRLIRLQNESHNMEQKREYENEIAFKENCSKGEFWYINSIYGEGVVKVTKCHNMSTSDYYYITLFFVYCTSVVSS